MIFKVVSSESTNIDLNTRLVQPEQNLVGSDRFLCNQSYINKGTIEQENQQQTTSGQHANAYEIFNSCKELSMENITIEDQSNIGSSTLNKVDSEVISNRKNLKRHRSSSRRSSKRFSTLSSCNGEKSTLNAADDTQLINTFVNGFKELCYWLRNLLVKGEIVAMGDIKITYENILRRRKESYSPVMLLGSAIRARL
ncbi:unnamed protein product [Rotaria magnacalcarata]|uniref:Uncharacterized protein n=3 Tax=Rotaria magnacalcarata TaxID=392030 RepID=A0A816NFR8_9BILA|nr:unnamed protein product [Rotaria magnacalcarata]CAF3982411.1 unnamed protein product [Rotaria magnacalcarata]